MGLPAQVQAQLDAANAIQAQLAQPPVAEAPAASELPAANDGTEPPKEPSSVAPATAEPAAPATPKNDDFAQLEQRYKSLQGMWHSSVSRLQKAEQQNAELAEQLQQAIAKLEQVAAPAAPSEPPAQSLVTDKDAEAFGTDLIDLARRVAKEQFGDREKQLLGQIQKLEQRLSAQDAKLGTVAETQVQSAQERFYGELDSKLSTWETIQATPECQQWLNTRVPATRNTWNQALLAAAGEFDAARALEVFDTFLAAYPALDPRKKAAPAPESRKAELQRQVAPSKSAAATATPQGKRVYSAREFDVEMNRVIQLGKARQYDDQAALENELNAALAEGRVTP